MLPPPPPPLLLLGLLCAGLLLLLLLLRSCGRTRRKGEPPLIKGLIPVLGKAFEFRKDTFTFLLEQEKKHGDVFTVQIAGKYMTFIMNPLLYPSIVKHGRQLDFHEFSDKVVPATFGYPPVFSGRFPGMHEQIQRTFRLLQGDQLSSLLESMMGNLMLILKQDYLESGGSEPSGWVAAGEADHRWRTDSMYEFCSIFMFEATILSMFGLPPHGKRHSAIRTLREDFMKFDNMFPLLIAQIPIWLLGNTEGIRRKLIDFFLPQRIMSWSNSSQFIKKRIEVLEQYSSLNDVDKAAHHFTMLWAAVGNTVPATFWAMYHLVSHPEALERVRQEIHDVVQLKDLRDQDATLSREHLDQLLYLESAVNESLRLSSASMNIRVAQEDFELQLEGWGSVAVRERDIVALYPQSMHMDPDIYPEPQMYKFDRFMEDGKEKTDFYKDGQRLKYYRMPFGSGSSMCPGRHLAVNEIKQFLSLLLLHFDLQLLEGQPEVKLDSSRAGLGILLPDSNVHFRYRLRAA
ncbi:cytochrome P450 7B1 [Lampris incognitus]|uniref:cytochrome P450 7B1 n=1 Tax=Lampris incognitus TaxID=2546036 RepID=UPI0024B4B9F0|nr:cytochrome P450 7B1 [Lampris incognitus]